MASIRQNIFPAALPDFRNLGVIARILIATIVALVVADTYATRNLSQAMDELAAHAAVGAPALLGAIVLLYLGSPTFRRWPHAAGTLGVLACAVLPAVGATLALRAYGADVTSPVRAGCWALLVAGVLLSYFRLRQQAFSPAIAEARLQALQARIRPHFLFNSLNAVLSLIRREPRRAEATLEDLADLFRTLMSDAREFVHLADELALIERYASIEQLRLGERLRITWEIDEAPSDAMMPSLVLQPLLENAIYHGVEPGNGVGDVLVSVERQGQRVRIRIENPFIAEHHQRAGNRMALENVRERLALFFHEEAALDTVIDNGRFRLSLTMPYRATPATSMAATAAALPPVSLTPTTAFSRSTPSAGVHGR